MAIPVTSAALSIRVQITPAILKLSATQKVAATPASISRQKAGMIRCHLGTVARISAMSSAWISAALVTVKQAATSLELATLLILS